MVSNGGKITNCSQMMCTLFFFFCHFLEDLVVILILEVTYSDGWLLKFS